MFKEVLHIVPQISTTDLNKMEQSLSKRFTNIAKGFSKGLAVVGVVSAAAVAIAALGAVIIHKLLEPLKEVKEVLDSILKRSENLETTAAHFGSTSGSLFKMQQMAQTRGLDPESLNTLLEKFQAAIIKTRESPDDPSAVRPYINNKDQVSAFYQFMNDRNVKSDIEKQAIDLNVFGERKVLGAAAFLDTKNFGALANESGVGGDTSGNTALFAKGAAMSIKKRADETSLKTKTLLTELHNVTGKNSKHILAASAGSDKLAAAKEIKNLGNISEMQVMQNSIDNIGNKIEGFIQKLDKFLPVIANALDKISNSRFVSGLIK